MYPLAARFLGPVASSFQGGVVSAPIVVVQDFATGTTTGSAISYPSTPLGGLTPAAVLVFASGHEVATGSAEQANGSIGFGFAAGGSEFGFSIYSEDGVGTTDCGNLRSDTQAFLLADMVATATFGRGDVATVPGGIEINYQNTNANRRGSYIAFAGTNVQASCGSADMGTGTTPVSISVGFEADLVFVAHGASTTLGFAHIIHSTMALGVATKDGAQRCFATTERDSIASGGNPRSAILTNRVGTNIAPDTGNQSWTLTAGSFTSTGFSITPSANTGGLDIAYLALKLGGNRAKIVDFSTPTSTGNQAITGAGFTPSMAFAILTNLEAANPTFPVAASDLCAGFSFCCIGNEQWSHSYRSDNGADPADTASFTANLALLGPSATDARAIQASLVSFDSDGMTLNYSSVQGTAKIGFIVFVE